MVRKKIENSYQHVTFYINYHKFVLAYLPKETNMRNILF